MTMLFFACIDKNGNLQECNCSGPDMESCFDALTTLVNGGWQLNSIGMLDSDKSITLLPAEAFDEVAMSSHLKSLQQEWEQILCQERRDK